MNNKQCRRLRKEMKKTNGFTLSVKDGYKADHRVAQTIKKPIYVTDSAGQMTIR